MKYTLKELRARNNLTVEQLAEKVGVSAQMVFNWEKKGSLPNVTNAIKVAEALQVKVEDIKWGL